MRKDYGNFGEKTLRLTHDWAVDRMHYLCSGDTFDLEGIDNACAIQQEFSEWLNPDKDDQRSFLWNTWEIREDEGNVQIYEL